MNSKSNILMFAVVATVLVTLTGITMAAQAPSDAAPTSEDDKLRFNVSSQGSVTLQGGNITKSDVTTNSTTLAWAGLYGNATGTIVLGDATGDRLFDWPGDGLYVYASTASSIDWGSLTDGACANLGVFAQNGNDACSNTFDDNGLFKSPTISQTIDPVTTALTYDGTGTEAWATHLLRDTNNGENLFVGNVTLAGSSYNNESVDYQMILPEDEETQAEAGTVSTFNLWMELQ